MAWALHEYRGRNRHHLPAHLVDLPLEQARRVALHVLLQVRQGVILPMLASGIRECLHVRLTAIDIPRMRVMGSDPVTNWSRNKLAEADTGDGSADYVRRLAASPEPVNGPFVAIGRSADGPIVFFDGMHRLAAWIAHVNEGRGYPIEAYLVITEWPSPAHELPAA